MSEQQAELELGTENDADFDAGFDGKSAPTETPEQQTPPAEQAQVQDQQVQQQEQPKYRQITEDEFNRLSASAASVDEMRATFGKRFDDAFGRIGRFDQALKQFQEQTPAGRAVEITDEDLAALREEFPDLAGPMGDVFKRIAGKMRGTGGEFDEGRVKQAVEPLLNQHGQDIESRAVVRAKVEMTEEALNDSHPNWREVIGIPTKEGEAPPETEYRKWMKTQPEGYQAKVWSTYNPAIIGKSIDKFQEHQTALKKKADSQRRDRIESAVTPRGDGGHPELGDGEDDFNDGYNGR